MKQTVPFSLSSVKEATWSIFHYPSYLPVKVTYFNRSIRSSSSLPLSGPSTPVLHPTTLSSVDTTIVQPHVYRHHRDFFDDLLPSSTSWFFGLELLPTKYCHNINDDSTILGPGSPVSPVLQLSSYVYQLYL